MTWFKSVNANIEPEDIGAVSTTLVSDSYSSSKTYAVDEYCIYNDTLWKCLVACTGETPTEGTYWTQVSIISELIALRQAISQGGGGMKALDYANIVTFSDSSSSFTPSKDGVLVTGNSDSYKKNVVISINDKNVSLGSGVVLPIKSGTKLKSYAYTHIFIPYAD